MTDPTKPFIGFPNAPKPKKGFRKVYADTWLDDFLKGLLGDTEPSGGTVLDPEDKSRRNRVKDIGEQAGILTSIPSQLLGLGALPLLGGAIRLGGAKDLVASHVSADPKALAKSGFLDAPSIGITANRGSAFASMRAPQLIFAAGKLDPMRQNYPTVLINRDAYIGSPSGRPGGGPKWDQGYFDHRWQSRMDEVKEAYGPGWPDLRMAHSFPTSGHGLAIAASPNFRSFREFERSPMGAQLLRKRAGVDAWAYQSALDKDIAEQARLVGGLGLSGHEYAKLLAKRYYNQGRDHLSNFELQLWDRASRSPSDMAELKHYGKVPLRPIDTAVYLGNDPFEFRNWEGFRDAGFPMFTEFHLPHQSGRSMGSGIEKQLPKIANPHGTFTLPKDMRLPERKIPNGGDPDKDFAEAWNAFIAPRAGTSPPLVKAAKMAPMDAAKILAPLPENQKAQKLKELAMQGKITHDAADNFIQVYKLHDYFHPDDLPWKKGKPSVGDDELDALPDPDTDIAAQWAHAGIKPPPLPKNLDEIKDELWPTVHMMLTAQKSGKEASDWLEKMNAAGFLPEEQLQLGLKFIDQKWPVQPPGQISQSLSEIFFGVPKLKAKQSSEELPDLMAPGLLAPKTPGAMGVPGGKLPDANLRLGGPQKIYYDTLMETADEYPLTMEELLAKIGPMSSKAQNEAVNTMWKAFESGLHNQPNWHKLLEDKIKDALMVMPEEDLPNQSFIKLLKLQ